MQLLSSAFNSNSSFTFSMFFYSNYFIFLAIYVCLYYFVIQALIQLSSRKTIKIHQMQQRQWKLPTARWCTESSLWRQRMQIIFRKLLGRSVFQKSFNFQRARSLKVCWLLIIVLFEKFCIIEFIYKKLQKSFKKLYKCLCDREIYKFYIHRYSFKKVCYIS